MQNLLYMRLVITLIIAGVVYMTSTLIHYIGMKTLQRGNIYNLISHECVSIYSQLSATSFITSIATRVKTAGTSLPDNHYVIIDSLSVLLRRHGLSVVTKLLDALTESQLPGEYMSTNCV